MSKDMKMMIQIDGDNSGLRQSLQQSGRDMKNFQRQTQESKSITALDLVGLKGAFMGAEALRGKLGRMQSTKGYAGLGAQHPKVAMKTMLQDLGIAAEQFRPRRRDRSFGMAASSFGNAAKTGYGLGQAGIMAAMPAIAGALKGGLIGGAIAAAAAGAVLKLGGAGKQQLSNATQFSAGISLEKAMVELRETQKQIRIAENPFLMDQQSRLLRAEEANKQAASVGLGYVATEAEIVFNQFMTGLKLFAASAMGADKITENGVIY